MPWVFVSQYLRFFDDGRPGSSVSEKMVGMLFDLRQDSLSSPGSNETDVSLLSFTVWDIE